MIIHYLIFDLKAKFLFINLKKIENNYFDENITVTGWSPQRASGAA
jgi:hypothetical protein